MHRAALALVVVLGGCGFRVGATGARRVNTPTGGAAGTPIARTGAIARTAGEVTPASDPGSFVGSFGLQTSFPIEHVPKDEGVRTLTTTINLWGGVDFFAGQPHDTLVGIGLGIDRPLIANRNPVLTVETQMMMGKLANSTSLFVGLGRKHADHEDGYGFSIGPYLGAYKGEASGNEVLLGIAFHMLGDLAGR